MQELEKILEEIDELHGKVGSECTSEDHFAKKAWEYCLECVEEIIRKHLSRENGPEITSCSRDKDGWIPVEERLPEVAGDIDDDNCPEFNVTIDGADKATTLKCSSDGTFFDDNGYVYPVIAWRPLPEPYRPERSGGK